MLKLFKSKMKKEDKKETEETKNSFRLFKKLLARLHIYLVMNKF